MNFSSWQFLLLYLPMVLALFCILPGARSRQYFLIVASLVFYAVSGLENLVVLLTSMGVNLGCGLLLTRGFESPLPRRLLLWAAVLANCGCLLLYKALALDISGGEGFRTAQDILIPLALSFVTFQQVGFVYSCYQGRLRQVNVSNYLFFIAFFPQLVMGPIVRFSDINRQLNQGRLGRVSPENMAIGLAIFTFGLAKKVLLADQLFLPVDSGFTGADRGSVSSPDMWLSAFSFQFQMIMDFTAYADMAIGLARMFSIDLPINFDRPALARNRLDLWRRWHISFAIFMRTHVVLPLLKQGRIPVVGVLVINGILSGLWHGLGWTFILWGLLQTLLVVIAHYRKRYVQWPDSNHIGIVALTVAMTFFITCLMGVLFRAPSLDNAMAVYGVMFSFSGYPRIFGYEELQILLVAAFLSAVFPETHQLFHRYWSAVDLRPFGNRPGNYARRSWLEFRINVFWALLTGILLFLCLFNLNVSGRFIYVQF